MTESITPEPIQEPVSVDDNGGALTVDGTVAVTEPVSVDDNGGSLTVDGTVTAVASGDHTVVGKAADGAAVSGNPVLIAGQDGTNAQSIKTDASGELQVDVLSQPALASGTDSVTAVGSVAHDTGTPGNPITVAGSAQDMDDTAPPARVSAESDVTRISTDRDGTQFMHPHGPQVWSMHFDGSTAQTDTSVHSAPGAGLSLYVTDIVFSSGAATAINLFFEESTTKVLGPYYLEAVAGRGLAIHFQTPKKITANTALTFTTSAAIAHAVDVTGFIAQG